MSAAISEKKSDDTMMMLICVSCGTAEGDDVKLKDCSACHLVKYCSVKCQKDHWPQHKKECKKRAAELHDEILFKQPECNHEGDCPICMIPLPLDVSVTTMMTCCGKIVCCGCYHANKMREIKERLQQKCPFCRKVVPKTEKEVNEQFMKRIEANDPFAICDMGTIKCNEGDYKSAFEYFTRAAVLGDVKAHFQLSTLYHEGKGIEKDEIRSLHHLTEAAIRGHPTARHNLGCVEKDNGNKKRAAKHFIIAAKLGYDESLECVKILYEAGYVSKEDFAAALRGHQAAIAATKSPQREEATTFYS